MLNNQWLRKLTQFDHRYSEEEFTRFMDKKKLLSYDKVILSSYEAEDSEINDGDSEDNNLDEELDESDKE